MQVSREARAGLLLGGLVAVLGAACGEAPSPVTPSPTPEAPAFSLHVASGTDIASYVGRCSTATLEPAPAPTSFEGTGWFLPLPSRRLLYGAWLGMGLYAFRIDPQVGSLSPLSAPGLPLNPASGGVVGADPRDQFFLLRYGSSSTSPPGCAVGKVLDSGEMGPVSAPPAVLAYLFPEPGPPDGYCSYSTYRVVEKMVGHPGGSFVYALQVDQRWSTCYPRYMRVFDFEVTAVWTLKLDRDSGALTPIPEGPLRNLHADNLTLDPLGKLAFVDTGSETAIFRIDAASGALLATGHSLPAGVIDVHPGGRFVYSSRNPFTRFFTSRVEPDGSSSSDEGQELFPQKYSPDLGTVRYVAFRVHPSGRFAYLLTSVEGGKAVPYLLMATVFGIDPSSGRLSELSRQELVLSKRPVTATFVVAPGAC